MRILLPLLAVIGLSRSSSILVDWSPHVLPSAQSYVLDYSPPVGHPPAGSILPGNTRRALLNGTISATEYTIYLSAIAEDGSRKNVTELTYYSSPDPPTLDSIETTENEATISYFPPQGTDISYNIEYYPEGQHEYANAVETKASLIRLRGLESGTQFRLKIRSIYKGVRSEKGIEASFKTQGEPVYDYSSSAEMFSVRTLPPDFDLATTTSSMVTEGESYSYEVSAETTEQTKEVRTTAMVSTTIPTNPTIVLTSSITSTTVQTTSAAPATEQTTAASTEMVVETTTVTAAPATTTKTTAKEEQSEPESIDAGEYEGTSGTEAVGLEQMVKEYGEPGEIEMSEEDGMIRLDWAIPEGQQCDAYFLNYTILSLNVPKSFSIASEDTFALTKMLPEHTLDLRVFCMFAGALSKTWWAHRIAYLSKPKPVEGLRIESTETDEFYVSKIVLDWDRSHDNPELYKVVVEYKPERGAAVEVEAPENGTLTLEKLEPAQLYKIAVRNQSTELTLRSKPVEIEQITPPLISSTLYPGQISSTAININFGESDPEQGRFDHYLLAFSGNNKNFTKKIGMHEERSLTFTKLIPGKTYIFQLYTVYKGVKSRAVTEAITTYPLKVNQLFPVVGSDYVVLYWDVENFADSDVRYRLSYNADKLPAVSVELKGSYHRFSSLQPDTYYTFTITVIMGAAKAAAESESEMITVHVPRMPPADPEVERQGSRELAVTFGSNIFSVLNGAFKNYAIIVSDDIETHDDSYELKSWFDVSEEDVWGAYRASPSDWNPFEKKRSAEKATFVIGSEDCMRRRLDEPFCNGILRAGVDYMVRVRAYTDMNVAIESDWVSPRGEGQEEEEPVKKTGRKYPCHMYINGCPDENSASTPSLLSVFIFAIALLLL